MEVWSERGDREGYGWMEEDVVERGGRAGGVVWCGGREGMGLEGCGWKRGVGGGVSEKELGVSEREAHHTVVESWSEDINPHDLRVAVI